jgi:hypothetical protein
MDRWKLVKEGKRLLIHREIVRRRGEVEADLVYDRFSATSLQALPGMSRYTRIRNRVMSAEVAQAGLGGSS